MNIKKRTVAIAENGELVDVVPEMAPPPAPPQAVVLMLHMGAVHVQWPPTLSPELALQTIRAAEKAVDTHIRAQNGGLILARG